eukprot:UN05704
MCVLSWVNVRGIYFDGIYIVRQLHFCCFE